MRNTRTPIFLLLAMSLFGIPSAHAADIKGTAGLGLDFGGDDLLKVTYTTGETSSIAAGDGFYVNGGAIITLNPESTMDVALTAGWKYTSIVSADGNASLSRFPLEAMFHYKLEKHVFGVGATYHAGIDFSGTGVLSDVGTPMESALGFMGSYEYSPTPTLGFGGKFTTLSYELTDFDEDVDAGSIGLYMVGRF